MPILARSMEDHLNEVKRANRAVSLEMGSVIVFLVGLALAVIALWPLVYSFLISVLPEDSDVSLERSISPEFVDLALGGWGIAISLLALLIPAALLMSAGVVMRRFWEKK